MNAFLQSLLERSVAPAEGVVTPRRPARFELDSGAVEPVTEAGQAMQTPSPATEWPVGMEDVEGSQPTLRRPSDSITIRPRSMHEEPIAASDEIVPADRIREATPLQEPGRADPSREPAGPPTEDRPRRATDLRSPRVAEHGESGDSRLSTPPADKRSARSSDPEAPEPRFEDASTRRVTSVVRKEPPRTTAPDRTADDAGQVSGKPAPVEKDWTSRPPVVPFQRGDARPDRRSDSSQGQETVQLESLDRPAEAAPEPTIRPRGNDALEALVPARREGGAGRSSDGPVVRVTIGRVEVRAERPRPQPEPAPSTPPRTPVLSLDKYLKQRSDGRR